MRREPPRAPMSWSTFGVVAGGAGTLASSWLEAWTSLDVRQASQWVISVVLVAAVVLFFRKMLWEGPSS